MLKHVENQLHHRNDETKFSQFLNSQYMLPFIISRLQRNQTNIIIGLTENSKTFSKILNPNEFHVMHQISAREHIWIAEGSLYPGFQLTLFHPAAGLYDPPSIFSKSVPIGFR